jgi:DNA-binding response OmpR family regulator
MPAKAAMPARARVLLLGDDPGLESSVAPALQAEGYEAFLVANSTRALELARVKGFDVLVLDLDFHCHEVRQLMAQLRAAEPRCHVLVFARSLEELALASETEADAVLMRPLDSTRIATVLNKLLSGLRMETLARWCNPDDTGAFSELPIFHRTRGIGG